MNTFRIYAFIEIFRRELFFPHENITFQWPKVVAEPIFRTNWEYNSIEKWSWIYVSEVPEPKVRKRPLGSLIHKGSRPMVVKYFKHEVGTWYVYDVLFVGLESLV